MVNFLAWMLKGRGEALSWIEGMVNGTGLGVVLGVGGRCTQSVPSSKMGFPGDPCRWQVWGTEGQSQEGRGSRGKFETKFPQQPKAPNSQPRLFLTKPLRPSGRMGGTLRSRGPPPRPAQSGQPEPFIS